MERFCAKQIYSRKLKCAFCVFLHAEGDNVVWKNVGEDVAIACRSSQKEPYLYLKKGLHENITLFYADKNSTKTHIKPENKIQQKGKFPNITFTIKNLTATDTGPYWCVFVSFDGKHKRTTEKSNGSILLVIKGEHHYIFKFVFRLKSPSDVHFLHYIRLRSVDEVM